MASAAILFRVSTMAAGLPAGATMPYQFSARRSGMPASAVVGPSGAAGARSGEPIAIPRSAPALICGNRRAPIGSLAVEQLDRGFMHARIARRDDAATPLRGLAFPCGDDAAGAGDDRNQRCDVVGLQFSLDHEIEMSGREHAIGIAIPAVARQP